MGVEVAAGWFKTGAGAGEDTAAMAFTPTGWGAFASSAQPRTALARELIASAIQVLAG